MKKMKKKIAIIDDEAKLLKALKKALEMEGHDVYDFTDPFRGLEFAQQRKLDLVISDIRMSGMNGIELLGKLNKTHPDLPCILMTAYSSVESAVTAVKLGARDYLLKPFELADFKAAVNNALATEPVHASALGDSQMIIGKSAATQKLHDIIDKIADTNSTVLISGDSGTGKELVARAIHKKSKRAHRPFIPVNCSAMPEPLFESEMFGHKKGSFTNAFTDKAGMFKEAESGTLFLDEIGELTPANQAKLLRVLQDGSYRPVGSNQFLKANVRVISASNRQLLAEVQNGNFREDLLYRINVVEIAIAPLRKRTEDIRELADFFINHFAIKHSRKVTGGDASLYKALEGYSWPGNVRQLENCIERAVIMKRKGQLTANDIHLPKDEAYESQSLQLDTDIPLHRAMDRLEENIILQTLDNCGWNYSKAAEAMGITRQNMHYKLKKYGISKDN